MAQEEKEEAMEQEDLFAGLTLEDISIDEEGRAVITKPEIAERLRTVMAAKVLRATSEAANQGCNSAQMCGCINVVPNCGTTNTVPGCGAINTVAGCGTKLR